MISRCGLGKLLASAAAFLGFKPKETRSEIYRLPEQYRSQWYPTPWENYQEFVNTPYLKRMDFSQMGYDVTPSNYDNKYAWINEQVLEFREQQPYVLGPNKRRVRYEASGKHASGGPLIKHDDHLRDQIRDVIKQSKGNGVA